MLWSSPTALQLRTIRHNPAHLLELHDVRVHQAPVIEDLTLHILCNLQQQNQGAQPPAGLLWIMPGEAKEDRGVQASTENAQTNR